jgi:hypothetical protein
MKLLTFSNDTWGAHPEGTTLTYAPLLGGCFNNGDVAGYVFGTYTGSTTAICKLTYSSVTTAALSATLSPGGGYVEGGMGDAGVAGYGYVHGYPYTGIQKITFSTDAHSTVGTASMVQTKRGTLTSATGTAGYVMGGLDEGSTGNAFDLVRRFEFPAETISVITATLSTATYYAASASNELALA